MIKFSIITCTYNAASFLQRTLDSVEDQTWMAVEHIIMDGASTDGTADMARRYKRESKAEGHDIVVVSERDRGLYDAMNKGIDMATGNYVLFLNAGDTLPSEDTLDIVASSVPDGNLPAVIYGDTDIVDNEGRFLRHRRLSPPDELTWRSFRYGMLVCHQTFYVRTDLARTTPYDLNYRFSADIDWCIRIMKKAARKGLPLLRVPEVLVNYLDGGMTSKNHRASLLERFYIMRSHYGLAVTLVMHVWFVIRGLKGKLGKRR